MIKFSTGGKLAPLLIHEILHAFIDTRFINFCSIIFFLFQFESIFVFVRAIL